MHLLGYLTSPFQILGYYLRKPGEISNISDYVSIRLCLWKILMVVNEWRMEIFVKGEMVCTQFCGPFHAIYSDVYVVFLNLVVVSLTGRGVDLNRNWSVDWGKKEKVCISLISICANSLLAYFYEDRKTTTLACVTVFSGVCQCYREM